MLLTEHLSMNQGVPFYFRQLIVNGSTLSYLSKIAWSQFLLCSCFHFVIGQCPEELFIGSQQQVYEFSNQYPNCEEIAGNLTIEGYDTDRIQDLTPLSAITKVGGHLFIGNNLSLSTVEGLQNITFVGGNLTISSNPTLQALVHFERLGEIAGNLQIVNNQQLQTMDFPSLSIVRKDLTVFLNPILSALSGFSQVENIGESLKILRNNLLLNLEGFSSLERITDKLIVFGNNNLTSLKGLSSVSFTPSQILLVANEQLRECTTQFCNTQLLYYIKDNACGCKDIRELQITCAGDSINCAAPYSISGNIFTATQLPISEVEIHLTGSKSDTVRTDQNGKYIFSDLPKGDYVIRAKKDSNYINGVTLADASLVERHVQGIPPLLYDPHKILAADIDQSQTITLDDSALVKEVAQGRITSWESVPSWGFIVTKILLNTNKDSIWEVLNNTPFQGKAIEIRQLESQKQGINFIGFKYGDVNDSVIP